MDPVEILPYGTVEREAREDGERIYTLAELPELLEEMREFKIATGKIKPDIDTLEELAELVTERAQLTQSEQPRTLV